jgi:S-adenosylmethionine decarboxylase proenzyme
MAKKTSSTANGQRKAEPKKDDEEPDKYRVLVSKRFVVLSLLACILAAFAVGRTARMLLLVNPQKEILQMSRAIADETKEESSLPAMKTLPDPKMKEGKFAPETVYTSKTFGTGSTGSSQSRWIVTEEGKEQCVDLPEHECPSKQPPSTDVSTNETGEVHLPAGQHLLLDIENVDGSFLNSEERLAHAMLELVGECGLTLLSYHCHKMVPMGVSCAGVLLESHVSFHTWPKEGVITLDLYTCGPNSLLPIVPLATKLFAVPKEVDGNAVEPNIVWAHKTRGYPQGDMESLEAEMSDMEYFPVGKMTDYKNEVSHTLDRTLSLCIAPSC